MAQRDNVDFYGTGWAFPLDAAGGRVATISDEANIAQAILMILRTNRGERVMMPDFGSDLDRLLFSAENRATFHLAEAAVRRALGKWEPRIKVLEVDVSPDPRERDRLLVSVEYVIRARNSRHNLVYPFYVR